MRLFSALWPPSAAVEHAAAAVHAVELPPQARRVPTGTWHLTLAFYGDDADPAERAAALDGRLAGLAAPRLRLAGAGSFGGVLWVGAEPAEDRDREALRAVAAAAGADPRFRPHLTVARWRRRRRDPALAERLAGYRGPVWTASQVHLVRSDPGRGYTTVHGVELIAW